MSWHNMALVRIAGATAHRNMYTKIVGVFMAQIAQANPFESDGEFGFKREVVEVHHGPNALVHLAVGQCDVPEALDVILDHQPAFEAWLTKTGREAFAVEDRSVGLYYIEEQVPMEGSGCVVISKPKK